MSWSWRCRVIVFYIIISVVMISFFVLFCIPVQFIGAPYSWRYKMSEIFSYIFIYLIWFICGIKFETEGVNKLPQDSKPYLALANHQSFWENFFMQLIIPKHSWVVKQELLDIPVFGRCLKTVRPIAIDRSNSSSVVKILKEGKRKIDDGLSIIMFPEATRISIDKSVQFKVSAAKLALNAKVPIALIAHNAGLVWPKGFWFKKQGTVKVKVIEVMLPEDFADQDARELTLYIQNKINLEKNKLIELGV